MTETGGLWKLLVIGCPAVLCALKGTKNPEWKWLGGKWSLCDDALPQNCLSQDGSPWMKVNSPSSEACKSQLEGMLLGRQAGADEVQWGRLTTPRASSTWGGSPVISKPPPCLSQRSAWHLRGLVPTEPRPRQACNLGPAWLACQQQTGFES